MQAFRNMVAEVAHLTREKKSGVLKEKIRGTLLSV